MNEGRSAPDTYGEPVRMAKREDVRVASVQRHYNADGNIKNGIPLVSDDGKLIKPLRIRAAWKWDAGQECWVLAVVKVTGPRLRVDQQGTLPGSERHASWHALDDAPGWVRRFADDHAPR